jgi:hypothetical protein
MLRSAMSVLTRVFTRRGVARTDPGSIHSSLAWVPVLRRIVKNAAPRPGHESNHCRAKVFMAM